MRNSLRQMLRTRLLPSRGIQRAHIIGCARSGTTMLHFAMAAFENVSLHPIESDLRYTPSITQAIKLSQKSRGCCFITKRDFGWFKPEAVEDTIHFLLSENIGLINVVRDPRDVLVSRHAGNTAKEFYVEPERWESSVNAGRKIIKAVSDHVPTLTLRYEDIVMRSDVCETLLIEKLGLTKNPRVGGLGQLADNITLTGTDTNPWMNRALHKMRNFDQRSIGAWKKDPEKRDYLRQLLDDRPELRRAIVEFMQEYKYDYTQSA